MDASEFLEYLIGEKTLVEKISGMNPKDILEGDNLFTKSPNVMGESQNLVNLSDSNIADLGANPRDSVAAYRAAVRNFGA